MANPGIIQIPQRYDLNPSARLLLSSEPGFQHRLLIFQPRDSSGYIRTIETLQEDGHPEFEHSPILYLETERDPVIPLYTTQVPPIKEWMVAVHYHGGREPKVYPFQSREEALSFQGLVTGYTTEETFQDVELVAVHDHEKSQLRWCKPWRWVSPKPEVTGRGEIQIWRRRRPAATTPTIPAGSSVATPSRFEAGSSLTSAARGRSTVNASMGTVSRQADAITVVSNGHGRQLILATRPDPPVLVAFLRNNGVHTMIKADLSKADSEVRGSMLHISPDPPGGSFNITKVTATEDNLASLDVCRLAVNAKNGPKEINHSVTTTTLKCAYITLESQSSWRDPARLDRNYVDAQVLKTRNEGALAIRIAILRVLRDYEDRELAVIKGGIGARGNTVPSLPAQQEGSSPMEAVPPLPSVSTTSRRALATVPPLPHLTTAAGSRTASLSPGGDPMLGRPWSPAELPAAAEPTSASELHADAVEVGPLEVQKILPRGDEKIVELHQPSWFVPASNNITIATTRRDYDSDEEFA